VTARARISDADLRRAAQVAAETGCEVAIEVGKKVYRITPKPEAQGEDDGYGAWKAKRGRREDPRSS
jgi:hypothetical protein